jgi:hypothetical protein
MSKHTPGPWRVSEHCTTIIKRDFRLIGDDSGELIASSHGMDGSGFFVGNDEAQANAHLIAASPDLLAALKALVQQVERGDFDHIGADHPDSAVGAARAAIAKAEVAA